MKSELSMGLVLSGGLRRLFVGRLTSVLEQLGPVKATSFHVARRSVNALHAGYAVSHYAALEPCSLIWIHVPDAMLEHVVRDLAAQMPVRNTMIVLCDSEHDSSWPHPLLAWGARIATVNPAEADRDGLFIGEGHPDTLRKLRRIFSRDHRKFRELKPGEKSTYLTGIRFARQLALPWIDAATRCLRRAGLSRADATTVVASLQARMMQAYHHSGTKAFDRSSAAALRSALERDAKRLACSDPCLAKLYAEGVRLSLQHFGL
jgi:hypothetical protein